MYQTGMCPALFQDLFDTVIFAKSIDLSDELNLKIILGGNGLRMGAQFFPQGIGKLRVVKDPDLVDIQKSVMPLSKYHPGIVPWITTRS